MPQPFFCVFSDTVVREENDLEYFQSIMLAHPVHSTAVRIMATDAPVPGRSNMRARTEPPHFHVEIFAVDSKADEPERLTLIGQTQFRSDVPTLDLKLKTIYTNQFLIRGNYTHLTLSL